MAKQKAPTPQELYKQRRLREEQERTAYLPPGMINHGNTCFMNSVLQGLIATRLLSDLVHFAPIPPAVQEKATTVISAKRSPQLTNGHNLAGPYEQAWVNSMPIGDQFLSILYKGWEFQAARRKDILSPKAVLNALGRKYDQYLDFAQQDAHEFLRILLDAMRMEEQDIIKQRQPLPPPQKKRRRSTLVPSTASPSPSLETDPAPREIAEDDKLMSFVDMIFGGRLTSILVCQKCKHVSQTYEDFNDISLSIKPEDYMDKKRNRLKNLAKRLANFPAPALPKFAAAEIQRSSSVPPSPKERPDGQLIGKEESPPSTSRRRSLEIHPTDSRGEVQGPKDDQNLDSTVEGSAPPVLVNVTGPPEEKHFDFVEVQASEVEEKMKDEKKKERENDDSNWARLGRRLSLTVGLGKPKDKKSRSHHRVSAPILEGVALDLPTEKAEGKRSLNDNVANPPSSSIRAASLDSRPIGSPQLPAVVSVRASLDNRLTPESTSIKASTASHKTTKETKVLRSKSPKPPKATPAETEYLRKILADVDTGSSANPFSIFKPNQHGSSSTSASPFLHQSAWLGLKTLSGIEECLRMFTAVEVLDGENMVGCRRCWKIANGEFPDARDEDSDGVEQEPAQDGAPKTSLPNINEPAASSTPPESHENPIAVPVPIRPGPLPHIKLPVHIPTSISTPTVSFYSHQPEEHGQDKSDGRSISSLPIHVEERNPSPSHTGSSSDGPDTADRTPGGFPIPSISTTGPEPELPPSSTPSITDVSAGEDSDAQDETKASSSNGITSSIQPFSRHRIQDIPTSDSIDSLPVPRRRFGGRKAADATTDDDSSGDETDTSIGTSVSADSNTPLVDIAPVKGIQTSQSTSNGATTSVPGQAASSSPQLPVPKKPSKPKPIIMRPAYKRYLIATPPPVLVIHLKRFQQLNKTPFLSFSHGFKKLDDYVTFPEYLDLTPFLAPKKEDYGLGRKGKKASKEGSEGKGRERCMYRLYAVVVHIGNMLGGHYIAYTALPSRSPVEGEGLATKQAEGPPPPASKAESSTDPTVTVHPEASPNPSNPSQIPSLTPIASSQSSLAPPAVATSVAPVAPFSPSSSSTTNKPNERQWAYISDTVVRLTTLEEVLNAKAYICMYERC